jgi:DNA repair exonuclease SbcCD ATPase subunit
LFHQLKNAQGLRERVKIDEPRRSNSFRRLRALMRRRSSRFERWKFLKSELAIEVAKTQLEFIQAAVDDHAKRLRLTLQDGKECPVCGSTSHPYSQHAPELEATAVKAAKKSVKDLEKKRDEALSREARLRGSMETRKRADRREDDGTRCHQGTGGRSSLFESHGHPEIAAVLAIDEDARLPVMEARLLELNGELRAINKNEHERSQCRKAHI